MAKDKDYELSANDVLGRGYNSEDEDDEFESGNDRGDANDYDGADDDDLEVVESEPEEETSEEPEEEAEPEEETAEEAEAPQEVEPEPEPEQAPKKDNNPMIPRARLNQEIQRRKQLEQQLQQLQAAQAAAQPAAQQPSVTQAKVDREAVAKALEKVLDGDVDNAADALAEVLTSLGGANTATQVQSPEQIAQAVKATLEQDKLTQTAERIVSENPFLDDTNEDMFDADAADDVIAMRDSYIQRGVSPSEALEIAVDRISKAYGYDTQPTAVEKSAPPKLKKADVAKKLEQAQKAPARIPKTTQPAKTAISVTEMSDDDFDNMSRDALRRARGDIT